MKMTQISWKFKKQLKFIKIVGKIFRFPILLQNLKLFKFSHIFPTKVFKQIYKIWDISSNLDIFIHFHKNLKSIKFHENFKNSLKFLQVRGHFHKFLHFFLKFVKFYEI
jgi:hypothetical protein